jgi:O-antigen ligase
MWSLDPLVSLRTAVSLVGTTLLGLFIGLTCSPRQIVRLVGWAFALLLVSSTLAIMILPIPASRSIGWRGIMSHKNTFGAAAELAAIYFLVMTWRRAMRPAWLGAALGALSVIALIQSRSRTSLGTLALAAVAFGYLSTTSPQRPTLATLRRLAVALVLCASVLPFIVGPIAAALGNDDPLNLRTRLWSGVATMMSERPLTGYGYGAVWGRKEASLLPHIPVTKHASAATAHNSVLNIAGELGIPAAIVACFYLFGVLTDAARLFKRESSTFSILTLLFLVSITVLGFMEAHLLRVHSMLWILFVALSVAAKRSLERQDDAASAEVAA